MSLTKTLFTVSVSFPYGPMLVERFLRWVRLLYKDKEKLSLVPEGHLQVINRRKASDLARYLGLWEPDLYEFLKGSLKNGSCFVDVGAHKGTYSLLAAKKVGCEGRVVSFEPDLNNYKALCEASKTNFSKGYLSVNPEAYRLALSDKKGIARISAQGPHIVEGELSGATDVETITLDMVVEKCGQVDFLKIDTDGHELEIIKGGYASFRAGKVKTLILEASNFNDGRQKIEEISTLLKNFGYVVGVLSTKGAVQTLSDLPKWRRNRELHYVFKRELAV